MSKIINARNLGVFVIALLIIGLFYFAIILRNDSDTLGSDNNTIASDGTQFPGPTEQELRDVDSVKERLAEDRTSDRTPGSKLNVIPIITGASTTEVRGYVNGVVEDGGICTATFTKGSENFQKSATGFVNASNTTCNVITLNRSDFSSPGTWSVVLSYSSNGAEGNSGLITIEVQ